MEEHRIENMPNFINLDGQKLYGKYYIVKNENKKKDSKKFFGIQCVIVQCHPIPNMVNDEVHRFSDIVKIYPNYEKKFEFTIEIVKTKISEVYTCKALTNLISDYFRSIDHYLVHLISDPDEKMSYKSQKVTLNQKLRLKGKYEKSVKIEELDMFVNNISLSSFYKINFAALRTSLEIRLLNSDDFIQSKSYQLIAERRPSHIIEISYLCIKEIILQHYGFRIVLKESGIVYTFQIYDSRKKNLLVEMMKDNCHNYLNNDIDITTNNHADSLVDRKLSKSSFENFFFRMEILVVTEFGDIFEVVMGVNDSYIYEIIENKINCQLKLKNLIDILLPIKHSDVPKVTLVFEREERRTYLFKKGEEKIFISNIFHIIETSFVKNRADRTSDPKKYHRLALEYKMSRFGILEFEKCDYSHYIYPPDNDPVMDRKYLDRMGDFIQDKDKLIENIDKLIMLSELENEVEFDSLCQNLCQTVIDIYNVLGQKLITEVIKVMRETQDVLSKAIFSKIYGKGFLSQKDDSDVLSGLKKDRENKLRDMKIKVEHLANSAQRYDVFLYPREIKQNIIHLTKILNFLTVATNNTFFYRYFAIKINLGQAKETNLSKNFITTLHNITTKSHHFPYLSYVSGNLLQKMLKSCNKNPDKKVESLNKNLLLSPKCDINFAKDSIGFLSQTILTSKNPTRLDTIRSNCLQISSVLSLFECVVFDRRDTTTPEDFYSLFKWMSSDIMFCILKILVWSESLNIVFKSSNLINSVMQSMGKKERIVAYQAQMLNHSVLILNQIYQIMKPVAKKQKQLSVVLIYHSLIENAAGCSLMSRIVPKPLFRRVDATSNDISKWTLIQWEQLFRVFMEDHCSATEQWNDDCRSELLKGILDTYDKIDSVIKLIEPSAISNSIEALDASHDGELEPEVSNQFLQIRWNHEEFEMDYEVLKRKLPVWKYYLEELFEDKSNTHLNLRINNPRHFWDELSIRKISTSNVNEQKKILTCMILLYQEYYEKIKDLSIIPYLIKLLKDPLQKKYQYLTLQLIFTCFTVESTDVVHQNLRRFHESDGLRVLRDLIFRNYFFEDLDSKNYEEIVNEYNQLRNKKRIKEHHYVHKSQQLYEMTLNYSTSNLTREAYTPTLEKSNSIILSLLIMKVILARTKSQSRDLMLYPRPSSRNIIMEQETINLIHQLLLIKDEYIRIAVHELIKYSYLDKFSLKQFLKNSGFYERTLLHFSEKSSKFAAENIREVFFCIASESGNLQEMYSQLANNGYILTDEAEEEGEAIELDEDREMSEDEPLEELKHPGYREFVKSFGLMNLIPEYLIHILVKKGAEEFTKIFFKDFHNYPSLIWNSQMREQLRAELESRLAKQRQKLRENFQKLKERHVFISSKVDYSTIKLVKVKNRPIRYDYLKGELKAGPIYLKVWIEYKYSNYVVNDLFIPRIISETSAELDVGAQEFLDLENLDKNLISLKKIKTIYVILKAQLKILKTYPIKYVNKLKTFATLIEGWCRFKDLMEQISKKPFEQDESDLELPSVCHLWDMIVCTILKIIYFNFSSYPKNVEQMIKDEKIKATILIALTKVLRRVYRDKFISYSEVKFLNNFIHILKVFQNQHKCIFTVFQDTNKTVADFYPLNVTICMILEIYDVYFNNIEGLNFQPVCDKNRVKDKGELKIGILDEGKNKTFDFTHTNIFEFTKNATINSVYFLKSEKKMLSLVNRLMGVLVKQSKNSEACDFFLSGCLIERMFNMSTFYVPKETRHQPTFLDANYYVMENLNSINLKAYKVLSNMLTLFLQASIAYGITNYDLLLKDVDKILINSLKEKTPSLKFDNPKKLEFSFNNYIDFYGEFYIVSLIKANNDEDNIYTLREYVVNGSHLPFFVFNEQRKIDLRLKCSKNVHMMLQNYDSNEVIGKKISFSRKESIRTGNEIQVDGIYLSSYIRNPINIENPLNFIDSCVARLKEEDQTSDQIVLTLKAVVCILRDNLHCTLKPKVVEILSEVYLDKGSSSFHVKDRVCDIFTAGSIIAINDQKEIEWIRIDAFKVMLLRVFMSIERDVDNSKHQLLIKWNIIIKQILQTNQGLNDFVSSHLILGVYRIVFDKNLTANLRKKYADVLANLHIFESNLSDFIGRIIKATRFPKQLDDLEASDFVQIFDKEVIHPRVAVSSKVCEYYTTCYNRIMQEIIDIIGKKGEVENFKSNLKFLKLENLKKEIVIEGVGLKLLILNQKRVKVLVKYIEMIPHILKELNNLIETLILPFKNNLEIPQGSQGCLIVTIEVDDGSANKLRAMLTSLVILSEFNDDIFEEAYLSKDHSYFDYSELVIGIIDKVWGKFEFAVGNDPDNIYFKFEEEVRLLLLEVFFLNFDYNKKSQKMFKFLLDGILLNPHNFDLEFEDEQDNEQLQGYRGRRWSMNKMKYSSINCVQNLEIYNLLYLYLANLFLLKSKRLCEEIDQKKLLDLAKLIEDKEKNPSVSLVYKNILATLIFHDAVSEENTSLLKKNLGLEYMEILSINAENLVYKYWRATPGFFHNSNYIEHFRSSKNQPNFPFVSKYVFDLET